MEMWQKEAVEPSWSFQDESNYNFIKLKYADRNALGDEAIAKRKALADIAAENPFYHRAAVSAELAQMRYEMAYIVAENNKLREMIGTISWLHEQLSLTQGAYAHTKMLAERNRIDYALFKSGMDRIVKLKEEFDNVLKQGCQKPDSKES